MRFSLSVWPQPMASLLPSVSVLVHRFHAGRPANGRRRTRRPLANQLAVAMLEAESIREGSFFPPSVPPPPPPPVFFTSSRYSRLIGCRQETLLPAKTACRLQAELLNTQALYFSESFFNHHQINAVCLYIVYLCIQV